MKNNLIGLLFAMLWASASVATKLGLQSAQPLAIANVRFFLAGIIMLLGAHLWRKYRLPERDEWQPLLIYGLLNVTIYLGLYRRRRQFIRCCESINDFDFIGFMDETRH
jgi:probable blue pigment (indigoidine) exporter